MTVWPFALATALVVGSAAAGSPPITRLVGSFDSLPDTPPGAVVGAAVRPHAAGDFVAFVAHVVDGNNVIFGVWLWDGSGFERVIDSTMPPGDGGSFEGVDASVGEDGLVGIRVLSSLGSSLLAWRDGVLTTISRHDDIPPGAPPGVTFFSFGDPSVVDGAVYALAALNNIPAEEAIRLYRWTEVTGFEEVSLPGLCCLGGPAPALQGGEVYLPARLLAQPQTSGAIYRRDSQGQLSEFFRVDSPFPGAPPGATWVSVATKLAVVGESIALSARDSTDTVYGMYRVSPTLVEPVLVAGELLPGIGEPAVVFEPTYSASGDRLAFIGQAATPLVHDLIVQEPDRLLRSIVASGGQLGGAEVNTVLITCGALSGDRLAFEVWQDDDIAVWLADLGPQPPNTLEVLTLDRAGLVLLALILLGAGLVRVRRWG